MGPILTPITITPLQVEQLPAVLDLDRRTLGGFWTVDGYQREIDSTCSDLLVLCAADSHTVLGLGCLWAILEEAHITILAIDPDFQGQGLGQALLYRLLSSAQQRHLAWATLEVRVSNLAAIALYRKFGFTEVGTRKNYYADGENALILWCKGIQKPEFAQQLAIWQGAVCDRLTQSGWKLFP